MKKILLYLCSFLVIAGCSTFQTRLFRLANSSSEVPDTLALIANPAPVMNGMYVPMDIKACYKSTSGTQRRSHTYLLVIGPWRVDRQPNDTHLDFKFHTDSILVRLLPSGRRISVLLDRARTERQQNIHSATQLDLLFDSLYIPPDIDSIEVSYDLRVIDGDSVVLSEESFSYNMHRFEDKYRIPKIFLWMMDK